MDRRSALRNCFVITAGIALIPACMQEKSKASILLKNIKISGEQEKMLAELSETIIPKTDTPGAKDVSAHLFVLTMVDDCFEPEDQKKFLAGLDKLETINRKNYRKGFVETTPQQRTELLTGLQAKKEDKDDEIAWFYYTVKNLTVQAFTGSQYYLTKVHVFEMAPGRYHGCVPLKSLKA